MEDLAPGLIEAVKAEFTSAYEKSGTIQELLDAVKAGTATYRQAQQYAIEVSRLIGAAYQKHVNSDTLPDGRMYYNIASRLIPASLDENYNLVAEYAKQVQQQLNKQAGLGMKPLVPQQNEDRVDGLVQLAASEEDYERVSGKLLGAFETYSQSIVDETIQTNVDFHGRAGLRPKVIRQATGRCCDWCRALAGVYDYPVDREVYRRHENCRCTVLYDPADGKRKRQNVHTKRWTDAADDDKLEKRKQIGKESLPLNLVNHPKRLASFTPAKLLAELEAAGFEVKPLMQGHLKGIAFEDGGGFKVNFEDGGILQYHPEKGSHHNGAYYKIATGKGGRKRYDTDGNEIPD